MKTQQLYEALEKRAQAGPRNKGTRDTPKKSAFEFLLPRENYVKSPKIHLISVIFYYFCASETHYNVTSCCMPHSNVCWERYAKKESHFVTLT